MYVFITRMGMGAIWQTKTYAAADEHPLYQYGDPILHTAFDVLRNYNRIELPGLFTRLGKAEYARKLEAELAACADRKARSDCLSAYSELAWKWIQEQAQELPDDPKTLCELITKDRRITKHKEFIMAKAKKVEEQVIDPETGEAVEAAPKPKRAKKEKAEGTSARTKVADTAIITLLADAEGKQYGAEHNPKRAGTESHARFAHYQDGMTVAEAIAAGLKRDDITWDVNKKYISLSAA